MFRWLEAPRGRGGGRKLLVRRRADCQSAHPCVAIGGRGASGDPLTGRDPGTSAAPSRRSHLTTTGRRNGPLLRRRSGRPARPGSTPERTIGFGTDPSVDVAGSVTRIETIRRTLVHRRKICCIGPRHGRPSGASRSRLRAGIATSVQVPLTWQGCPEWSASGWCCPVRRVWIPADPRALWTSALSDPIVRRVNRLVVAGAGAGRRA